MIEQLKTIRALFHGLDMDNALTEGGDVRALEIYDALTQLEAMVGEQEPVAYLWCHETAGFDGGPMMQLHFHGNEKGHQPNWTVSPLYAAPVAQQPQARPDFADEWTGYLKDGETPFERFLRERKDLGALTKLYQRALEENERLKAQQPQAEPDDEILKERDDAEDFIDMLLDEVLGTDRPEWTSAYGRDDALRDVQERMTALHKPTVDKAWDRFEKAQQPPAEAVPDCGEAGHDEGCCGNRDCLPSARKKAPQQAEAVPSDVTDAMVDAYLKANDAYWRETDTQPKSPTKWRNGNPKEATRVSLAAAIAQQKGGL